MCSCGKTVDFLFLLLDLLHRRSSFDITTNKTPDSLVNNKMIITFRDILQGMFSLPGLVLVGAVVTLLPIWIVQSQIENSPLRKAMTSSDRADVLRYQGSSIALLALLAPIALDLIVDAGFEGIKQCFFVGNEKANMLPKLRDGKNDAAISLNRYEKILFVTGLIITPITAFLPSTISNLASVYSSCRLCSFVFISGTFIASCHRYSPRYTTLTQPLPLLSHTHHKPYYSPYHILQYHDNTLQTLSYLVTEPNPNQTDFVETTLLLS